MAVRGNLQSMIEINLKKIIICILGSEAHMKLNSISPCCCFDNLLLLDTSPLLSKLGLERLEKLLFSGFKTTSDGISESSALNAGETEKLRESRGL